MQMKADTLGMPVSSMKTSEAASLGAAMLAGVSVGAFDDARRAAESMVQIDCTYDPNEERSRQYQDVYEKYKQLYPTLKDYNHLLADSERVWK